ncbi:MAG: T9SS type A sorting domain-containing protein [Ignavibacteriaceae bacterium]|nr:T9SS type A sorting domain-containing protein [Ignavibacteriaceae bacterium]MCU0413408.1 T9SS type A sorting domain-containing protein [Ignavibacteriaceae bacterium]
MKKIFSFVLFVLLVVSTFSFAQGSFNSGPEVAQCIHHDTSPPLRDMPEAPITHSNWRDGIVPLFTNPPRFQDHYQPDPALQETMGERGDGFVVQTWDGVGASGYAPPDNNGDVGPNHYMETVNSRFQIWNKTGTSLLGPLNLGTIWSGFPGPWSSSLNDGDPIVLYDEAANRFFVAQFSLPNYPNGPFYIIMAVSQTGDPTGSWHRYGFSYANMPDYPKFGIWPDGYYMSANAFSSGSLNFVGTYVTAFERSQMLTGATAQSVTFTGSGATTWSFLPSDWNGATTPPAGSPNYFGQLHDNAFYGGSDGFDIYSFSVNWATPASSTFTGPSFIATSPYITVNGIPQQGTSTLLDNLAVMTMFRLDYRNFGTHQSMVVCHTIDAGGSRAGMRWYEFRKPAATWALHQEGTYAPADGLERWMGSIAINAAGHIALGYSISSSTMFPSIRYTGRYASDPLGQMTIPEETIYAGLGSQTSLTRWGDYTSMNVDPNGVNFWYVNQYQPSTGSFNWRTRIANIDYTVPVELISFNASIVKDAVELSWMTATETNNQGFEIERMSINGEFEQVGFVEGYGTTTEPQAYSFIDSKLETGSYTYRLKQIDFDGSFEYSNEIKAEVEIPLAYSLEQNYPNPFNPSTKISYSIPADGYVKLAVYNLLGEEVATIVNSFQKADRYEVNFNASGLSSGVYVYKIESANYTSSRKLVLMK